MSDFKHILVDVPSPGVSRITLNRPESRNALNNTLRGELYGQLEANDKDPAVQVTIIRGAGKAFCAGYDLKANNRADQPFHTAGGDGNWARHVVDGVFQGLGPGKTGHCASSWLLPGGWHGARHLLRPGVCCRGCQHRVSRCAVNEPTGQSIFSSLTRFAERHGDDADGQCDLRH